MTEQRHDTGPHPTPFRLEAWHAGEDDDEVAQHLPGCAICQAYVDDLARCRTAFVAERNAEAAVRAARQQLEAPRGQPRRWLRWIALPAAAALAVLLLLWPRGVAPPTDRTDAIRLKGGLGLAVIRLAADGRQSRHQGEVVVQPGDRLRVELTVPRSMVLAVGLLEEQERGWTLLRPARRLAAGVHRLARPLEVDARPTAAWLIAGPPEAVARARKQPTGVAGVARLRLRSVTEPPR
jgi:hypothetical protein